MYNRWNVKLSCFMNYSRSLPLTKYSSIFDEGIPYFVQCSIFGKESYWYIEHTLWRHQNFWFRPLIVYLYLYLLYINKHKYVFPGFQLRRIEIAHPHNQEIIYALYLLEDHMQLIRFIEWFERVFKCITSNTITIQ